jgi:hypothetical protein
MVFFFQKKKQKALFRFAEDCNSAKPTLGLFVKSINYPERAIYQNNISVIVIVFFFFQKKKQKALVRFAEG